MYLGEHAGSTRQKKHDRPSVEPLLASLRRRAGSLANYSLVFSCWLVRRCFVFI